MSQKIRKEYTEQQKAEAVEIVVSTEQSVRQVARNLGIAESSLSRWVRESQGNTATKLSGVLSRDERQELVQLRRQVKPLEMERDFLKKQPPSLLGICRRAVRIDRRREGKLPGPVDVSMAQGQPQWVLPLVGGQPQPTPTARTHPGTEGDGYF